MALVYGIRKFEHILSFKPFQVKTDSMTLTFRPKIRPTTGILARWMEYLAGFEFIVQHIAGKKNVVADAISRTPHHLDDPSKDEEEEAAAYAIHMIQIAPEPPPPTAMLNLNKFSGQELEKAQKEDVILSQVMKWIKDPSSQQEHRVSKGLH